MHLELGHQGVQLCLLLFELRCERILLAVVVLTGELLLYLLNSRFKRCLGVELFRGQPELQDDAQALGSFSDMQDRATAGTEPK